MRTADEICQQPNEDPDKDNRQADDNGGADRGGGGANGGGAGTLSGLGMADALCRSCGIELVAGRIPGGGRVRLRLPRERVIQ